MTRPVDSVRATASAFIHAIISTSPVSSSWAIAGIRPRASRRSVAGSNGMVGSGVLRA